MEYINKKMLFCLIGKSGSGKDSIKTRIIELIPVLSNLCPFTTRDKRKNETNGKDYVFIENNEFQNMIKEGRFLDHRKYNMIDLQNKDKIDPRYYGYPYPKDPISITIYPFNVYKNITSKNIDNIIFIPIYIKAKSDEELLYRQIIRESKAYSPNYREVARRFCADLRDFPEDDINEVFKNNKGIFVNDNLDNTVTDVYNYIKSEINEVYNYGM